MAGYRGYYSLIQYCPDFSRLEVANIGVALFCPELRFLKAEMARGNDRIRRFFSGHGIDLDHIEHAKTAIAERLEVGQQDFQNVEELRAFIAARGNDVILTEPRPTRVVDPARDLKELFAELVGGRKHKSKERDKPEVPELVRLLRSANIENKLRYHQAVELPIVGRKMQIPYAYRNGSLNLIKPKRFVGPESNVLQGAYNLAVDGGLLQRHPEGGVARKLIVVSVFEGARPELSDKVHRLLEDNHVRYVAEDYLEKFVEEIGHQAHF